MGFGYHQQVPLRLPASSFRENFASIWSDSGDWLGFLWTSGPKTAGAVAAIVGTMTNEMI